MQPDETPISHYEAIDFDQLEQQSAEEEARIQQEVDQIKQSYVDKFGEPDTTANALR